MFRVVKSRWAFGIFGVVAFGMIIFGSGCKDQEVSSVQAKETVSQPVQSSRQIPEQRQPSEASQKLTRAHSTGKYAYVLFYETGNADCEIMTTNLDAFAQKTKKDIEIIKIDRKDPMNRDIVRSMRTQSASVPLTLLTAPSGLIVSALTKVATVEEIEQAFPSPKKEEALKYIQQKKGVILCFCDGDMPSCKEIRGCCSQAESKLAGKAEYISVDMNDPEEAGFIKDLKINPLAAEPITYVLNPQGQVTGKYEGGVQVDDLVAAATRVTRSGCCPPGSGKTCGPTKSNTNQAQKSTP